jgi:hypothetical protein
MMNMNMNWIKSLITETELGPNGKLEKQSQCNAWKLSVTGKLLKKGLRSCIVKKTGPTDEEKNEKAMGIILENLGELFANQVKDEADAYSMWEKVISLCNVDTITNCRGVEEFILRTKIGDHQNSIKYLADMKKAYDFLKVSKHTDFVMSDGKFIRIICENLPKDFQLFVHQIYGAEKTSWQDFATKLNDFEIRNGIRPSTQDKLGNVTAMKANGNRRVQRPNNLKFSGNCNFCGVKGHKEANCFKKRTNQGGKGYNSYRTEGKGLAALRATESDTSNTLVPFIVDSGCSTHLTNCRELLKDTKASDTNITIADGKMINGTMTGKVYGQYVTLSDVIYCENVDHSLLSVARLTNDGYTLKFQNDLLKIQTPEGKKINVYAEENGLFMVGFQLKSEDAYMATTSHEVFGHPGKNQTLYLQREGVKINPANNCEVCIQAKGTTKPFKKGRSNNPEPRTKSVALDLVGPMETTGVNGERYVLVLVHYETNATFVEPIIRKGDQVKNIMCYINQILARGFRVESVICDNSAENLESDLLSFYGEKGIEVKSTNTYTSNQNAIAERRIRTLMDKTRCLLLSSKIDKKFWPFAVLTAGYLLNITPNQKGVSAYELWHKKKPNYDRLFVFGEDVLVQIKPKVTGKLEKRFDNGIFLGYSNNGFITLVDQKLVYSRDVYRNSNPRLKEVPENNSNDENDRAIQLG